MCDARSCVILIAAMPWLSGGVFAQEPDGTAPLHVSFVDDTARIERNGQMAVAEVGHILAFGDRLRTEAGRAEVRWGDGTVLHLDCIRRWRCSTTVRFDFLLVG